jgi:glucose-6-phosphate 1-dehydrogenase
VGHDVELILNQQPESEMPPYQRLLGDAMRGVRDLFTRQDLVNEQWRIVDPVLDNVTPLYTYERGTWGPEEAAELIGNDGPWRDPKPGKVG